MLTSKNKKIVFKYILKKKTMHPSSGLLICIPFIGAIIILFLLARNQSYNRKINKEIAIYLRKYKISKKDYKYFLTHNKSVKNLKAKQAKKSEVFFNYLLIFTIIYTIIALGLGIGLGVAAHYDKI